MSVFLTLLFNIVRQPCAEALLINVIVNPATSTLSYTVSAADLNKTVNVPTVNYRIRGTIGLLGVITLPSTYASVSTLTLILKNGTSTIPVYIGGTIGGLPPSTVAKQVTATGTTPATVDLTGDLDESAIGPTTAAGAYTGSITITASLL